jgi:hypothetical protein
MYCEGSLRLEHLAAYITPESINVGLDVMAEHASVGEFPIVFRTFNYIRLLLGLVSLILLVLIFTQNIHALERHHLNRMLSGGRQLGLRRRICFLSEGRAATSL